MGYRHHGHIGAAAMGALLDGTGSFGEDFPEADGAGCFPAAGGDNISGGPQVIEGKTGTPACPLDQGGIANRGKYPLDTVGYWQNKTGTEHAIWAAGIHEGGAVGQEKSL